MNVSISKRIKILPANPTTFKQATWLMSMRETMAPQETGAHRH
jgi:hypothetical protein